MGAVTYDGPLIIFGQVNGVGGDYNEERAPSLFDLGVALLDPRAPFTFTPGQGVGAGNGVAGWLTAADVQTINQIPAAPAANNIAASQTPTANTPLTLVSASGAGVTVGASVVNALTGVLIKNLLALDGAMGRVAFGSGATVALWDPTKASSRVPTVASVGNDSTATFTFKGFDIYGFPMTQVLTGANAGTATCTKAFKYILSVTPAGTLSGSAVTVGFNNSIIGLPLRSDTFPDVDINVGPPATATWATSPGTGYTAAVTSTATGTTGDVRGTIAMNLVTGGAAANGSTVRLAVYQSPAVSNIVSVSNAVVTGLFGVAQF